MTLLKKHSDNKVRNFPDLLEDFFGTDLWDRTNALTGGSSLPSVNIKDEKDNYKIEVAAPGLKKDDFNLELDDHTLIISSEKRDEKKDEDKNYTRREFSYQSFQRMFDLPESVKEEDIQATYNDGVLSITVPKKEEAKQKEPKKIEIK